MEKKLFRSLILLITYAVVLVAVIVKLDAVGGCGNLGRKDV